MTRDLAVVFDELRPIFEPYRAGLVVTKDTDRALSLDTPYSERWKKELFFGSVEVKKRYVSVHLFPVYMYPDLLDDVSDDLRGRMQGKSCFNFTRAEAGVRDELAELVRRGLERLRAEGDIPA